MLKHYVDEDLNCFLEENVEAVIELIKKAHISTANYFKDKKIYDDFIYFDASHVFLKGYCYYFAKTLKSVYKNAKYVVVDKNYAHISHIFALINGEVYDFYGKHDLKDYYVLTDNDIKFIEQNHRPIDSRVYFVFTNYFKKYANEYIRLNSVVINGGKDCI